MAGFHQPVTPRPIKLDSFKGRIEVQGRLGPAQKQVAVRTEEAPDLCQDLLLGLHAKVDQHVAQQDDVHGRQRRPGFDQVEPAELDLPPNFLFDLPVLPVFLEILHQQPGGQVAVYFQLTVAALPGPVEDFQRPEKDGKGRSLISKGSNELRPLFRLK